jgi:hypothetical protein
MGGREGTFVAMLQLSKCPIHIHCNRQNIVRFYILGAFILEFVIMMKYNCFVVFECSVL